jgi:hypothetical protein
MGFEDTVRITTEWYKSYYQNPIQIAEVTRKQIVTYTEFAKQLGLAWAQ